MIKIKIDPALLSPRIRDPDSFVGKKVRGREVSP